MTAPPNLRPKQIETRFIYPFFFHRDHANEASRVLEEAAIAGRGGEPIRIWECCDPPALYKEELLDHVEKFLLQSAGRGCRYLRVSSAASSKWFNKLQAILIEPGQSASAPLSWPVSLAPIAGIEIFLTNYGVGLLSIGLKPEVEPDFETATLFNYKLAQLRSQVSARLHIPHPSENKNVWVHMTTEQKEKIPTAPGIDSPVHDRIGVAGGTFMLGEMVTQVLLRPLSDLEFKPFQNQFSVYTVVRFGAEVDFDKPDISKGLAAFLSGICQIEEPNHAGSPAGVVGVVHAVLNRRHFAAVGLLGMAHLVSDQPDDNAFNEQRVPRAMTKYFVPWLAAMLQRVALQRNIREASDFVLNKRQETPAGLSRLRRHMLEFAVEGYFPEISHREVLDRYYRMVQDGLGVRRAFEDVSRSIGDIAAQFTADHEAELAEAMAENVAATTKMQHHVSLLERFIVSVYAAELWHMTTSDVERLHRWVPYGVIAFAILGFVCAWALEKLWNNRANGKGSHQTGLKEG